MLLELGAIRHGREWRQVHFVQEFRFPAEVQAAMTAPGITMATTTTNITTSAPKATIIALLIILLLLNQTGRQQATWPLLMLNGPNRTMLARQRMWSLASV